MNVTTSPTSASGSLMNVTTSPTSASGLLTNATTSPTNASGLQTNLSSRAGWREPARHCLVSGGVTEGTRTPDLRDHNPTL